MRRLEFTCDGCSRIQHVAMPDRAVLPRDGRIGIAPEGWAAQPASIRENGAESHEADLCPECIEKMRRARQLLRWLSAEWPERSPSVAKR